MIQSVSHNGSGNTKRDRHKQNWSMWRRLNNGLQSLRTYDDLSPDIRLRRRINRSLLMRPFYHAHEWYTLFWQPLQVSKGVARFVFDAIEQHSGLQMARVVKSDRLIEDLQLPLVCWFNWETQFYADFCNHFGVETDDCFDIHDFDTIEDLVLFLDAQSKVQNPQTE